MPVLLAVAPVTGQAAGGLKALIAPAAAASPASSAASAPGDTPGITLSDIVDALGTRDQLNARVNEALESKERLDGFVPRLFEQEKAMGEAGADVSREGLRQASSERLLDIDTQLAGTQERLVGQIDQLKEDARVLETLLNDIRRERALWIFRAEAARERDAAPEFLARVEAAPQDLESLADQVRPLRDQAISLLGQAVSLRSRGHDLRSELSIRRQRINNRLRDAEEAPLWHLMLHSRPRELSDFVTQVRAEWRSIFAYVREQGVVLAALLLAIFGGSIAALRATQRALEQARLTSTLDASRALNVLARTGWAAALLGLLGTTLLAPRAPVAFYDFVWLFIPVPAAVLTHAALGDRHRTLIYAVAVALLAQPFMSLLELAPFAERIVLLVQCLGVIAAVVHDHRRNTAFEGPPTMHRRRVRGALVIVAVLLAVAAWSAVVGHVGTARTLRSGVLATLGLAMVILASYEALLGIGLVALSSRWFHWSHAVQRRRAVIERAWRGVLRTVGWVLMALTPILAFGLGSRLPDALSTLMDDRIRVGETGIAVGSLTAGVACLVVTWAIVKAIRLLLEDEILPRLNLGQGLPFAISALTRYAIATIGLFVALAAAGIDLSKMALLAGAIGVGIGFGLQNIINNFVSGIVLLVERPMHVGDMVETPTATGFVQRIGFRASVIRTTDGADIVVPNGDLLSKELLNWTRTNRLRRFTVEVGVAYGADPRVVSELLRSAAHDHASVLAEPPPFALFTGFGESSLNFRLLGWVGEATIAGDVASDLRSQLVVRLREAGIDIPFPQREVLVRHLGPAAPGGDVPAIPPAMPPAAL